MPAPKDGKINIATVSMDVPNMDNLDSQKLSDMGAKVDNFCKLAFPIVFVIGCAAYWGVYS